MGQSDGRQFKTALEKLGGEVVGVAGAPLDTKDFSPWFGAINQSNPDVLFVAFAGTDSLRLMTQLHSFGMTKKYKMRSEEHTSELQSPCNLVCRLLLEKKKNTN